MKSRQTYEINFYTSMEDFNNRCVDHNVDGFTKKADAIKHAKLLLNCYQFAVAKVQSMDREFIEIFENERMIELEKTLTK
jgi:hypothetical protein